MRKPQEIEEFIRMCFKEYGLNRTDFFSCFDDSEELRELPLVEGGKLCMPQVETAAFVLGATVDDLLDMNEEAIFKWYEQYSFFALRPRFEVAYRRSFHESEMFDKLIHLEFMLEVKMTPPYPTRYNYADVKQRMISLLKEIDQSMPGTFHPNAEINKLAVYTQNFGHFEKVSELINSYIQMLERAKGLFFKAWDTELPEEEIREYNFLVSVLGLRDSCYIRQRLYYDLLRLFIPIYKEEGYKDFKSYVTILSKDALQPWKCSEFTEDRNLVQRYLNVCPQAKPAMREFALSVLAFDCSFVWSDAPLIREEWTEAEKTEFGIDAGGLMDDEGFEDTPPQQERTRILVPKTEEELSSDGQYAKRLKEMSGPSDMGGIELPQLEISNRFDVVAAKRLQARIQLRPHGWKGEF